MSRAIDLVHELFDRVVLASFRPNFVGRYALMAPVTVLVAAAQPIPRQADVVFDISGAQNHHDLDGDNEIRIFDVVAEGVITPGAFSWDIEYETFKFNGESSYGSEVRIQITSPQGTIITLAGDADFGWPDAGGVFTDQGITNGFVGEAITGSWEFLFYESHDTFLNSADGVYTCLPSVFVIDITSVIGDLDDDGTVGVSDLLILLGSWGRCADCDDCIADIDGNCTVGVNDLLILLGNWG